ncbi:MAG: C45 family autoproteolytic acyltransferase/hydrolase, partial [Pyrinomonadaceae bacterium]
PPYYPGGTIQAKAADSKMTEKMQLWAAMGHQCASDFIAEDFLKAHSEYEWMRDILPDMKTQPWTSFVSGMKVP